MKRLTETKKEAIKIKKDLIGKGKSDIHIYKFADKRKKHFFVGNWWEWLSKIS